MARPGKEACSVEAAVKLLARIRVGLWNLGRGLVKRFCLVEVPLLLVGEEFENDKAEDDFCEDLVVDGEVVSGQARAEEEDIGRSRDCEE